MQLPPDRHARDACTALQHQTSSRHESLALYPLGTPDDLELADIAEPTAGPGEAVVRVEAAALNFFDTLIIAGKYQTKPPLPFSPAAEFAGRWRASARG